MSWAFFRVRDRLDDYVSLWDGLNQSQGNQLVLDSKFVFPLIRHFSTRQTLLAVNKATSSPAMVWLEKLPWGIWQTFQPSQAPLGLVLFGESTNSFQRAEELVRELPGYALQLSILQQDPDNTVFPWREELPATCERVPYIQTGRLSLRGGFDQYWNSRGKDLVDNLARRSRQLSRQNMESHFSIISDPSLMRQCIDEYAELEQSGWKERQGTALKQNTPQGRSYFEIMEGFCQCNEGRVYRLQFNGKIVAAQLGVERQGTLVLLKMAYDDKFRSFSPGFLLQKEIIGSLFSEGRVKTIEFYGRVREGWTLKWTEEVRIMHHLNMFRHSWVKSGRDWISRARSAVGSRRRVPASPS